MLLRRRLRLLRRRLLLQLVNLTEAATDHANVDHDDRRQYVEHNEHARGLVLELHIRIAIGRVHVVADRHQKHQRSDEHQQGAHQRCNVQGDERLVRHRLRWLPRSAELQ